MDTMLHIKTDKKVQSQLARLAKKNGITITALVNISLRNLLNSPRIEVYDPPVNARTARRLDQAMKDAREGKNMAGPFYTAEETTNYLKSLMKRK